MLIFLLVMIILPAVYVLHRVKVSNPEDHWKLLSDVCMACYSKNAH